MLILNYLKNSKTKFPTIFTAFVLFWLPVIIFLKIAGEILENEFFGFDSRLLHWLHDHSSAFWDRFFLTITLFGNAEVLVPIALLVVGGLYYKKLYRSAGIVALGVGGAAFANLLLKMLFHRVRPSFWQPPITETSFSFPSGHAMATSALIFSLIYISWRTKLGYVVLVLGLVLMVLVGLSRLYLGVHYPTDVLAGWCVSLGWLTLVHYIFNRYKIL